MTHLPAAVLDDEPDGAGRLGAMIDGKGRDGEVSQHDRNARLKRAEIAPLGQVAMDAARGRSSQHAGLA